jgi:hypothetical protein
VKDNVVLEFVNQSVKITAYFLLVSRSGICGNLPPCLSLCGVAGTVLCVLNMSVFFSFYAGISRM